MREKMERFSILPFSIGCVSQSSIEVVTNHPKKLPTDSNASQPSEEGEEKMKSSNNIGERFQKLVKSFKILPHVFQLYREEEEEEEAEMEIGVPTDVQHVAHIGWDGSNNTPKSWNGTREMLSFPFSLSEASV